MKRGKIRLFLAAFAAVFFAFNFNQIDSSAYNSAYDALYMDSDGDEMGVMDWLVTGVTKTSITVDIAKIQKKRLTQLKNQYGDNFVSLAFSVAIEDKTTKSSGSTKPKYIELKGKTTKHTFSKLKEKTGYRVYLKYEYKYKQGGETKTDDYTDYTELSTDGFDELPLSIKGVTDTTATIDWSNALSKVYNEETSTSEFEYFSIGYAKVGKYKTKKEKTTAENKAVTKAKEMAWRHEITIASKARTIALTDLEPNATYAVCVLIRSNVHVNGKATTTISYAVIRNLKTTEATGIGKQSEDPCRRRDPNADLPVVLLKNSDAISINGVNDDGKGGFYDVMTNGNTITLNWKDNISYTRAADGVFSIGYAKETIFDAYEKIGKTGNPLGGDFKPAYDMAKAKKLTANASATEYTIRNLDPGAFYTIVLRFALKDTDGASRTYYAFTEHVCPNKTRTDKTMFDGLDDIQQGYMYDFKVTRDKNDAIIDWTDAIKAFTSQKGLNDYIIRYDEGGTGVLYSSRKYLSRTGQSLSADERYYMYKSIYRGINQYKSDRQLYSLKFDQKRTKTRLYGISEKDNVFALKLNFIAYSYGGSYERFSTVFFVEEGGVNYFRELKTSGKDPLGLHNLGQKTLSLSYDGVKLESRDACAILNTLYTEGRQYDSKTCVYHDSNENCYYVDFNSDGKNELRFSATSDNKYLVKIIDDSVFKGKRVYATLSKNDLYDHEYDCEKITEDGEYIYQKVTIIFPASRPAADTNKPDDKKDDSSKAKDDTKKSQETKKPDNKTDNKKADNSSSGKTSAAKKAKKTYLSKKKKHAYITIDKQTIKASKVKKKAQKIEIGIENSKGKIKVKNTTQKSLKKYIDYKIKKGKVVVTIKKGAKKGTYKLKVTVGASGKIRKTTETIRIKVK